MFKTIGTMTKGQFQIALHGTNADLKSRGNLMRRLAIDRNAAKDLARPRRQLRKCTFEGLDLRARLNHSGWIRFIVADIEQRVDLGRTDAIILSLLAILRDIDRGTKDVVGGTAYGFGVRYPVETKECLVQGLVGEIGRPQTTRELPDQSVVVLDQLPPQPYSIGISHPSRAQNTLTLSARPLPQDRLVVPLPGNTFMTQSTTREKAS